MGTLIEGSIYPFFLAFPFCSIKGIFIGYLNLNQLKNLEM